MSDGYVTDTADEVVETTGASMTLFFVFSLLCNPPYRHCRAIVCCGPDCFIVEATDVPVAVAITGNRPSLEFYFVTGVRGDHFRSSPGVSSWAPRLGLVLGPFSDHTAFGSVEP